MHLLHIEEKRKLEFDQAFKLNEFCIANLFPPYFSGLPECGLIMKERKAYIFNEYILATEMAYSWFVGIRPTF